MIIELIEVILISAGLLLSTLALAIYTFKEDKEIDIEIWKEGK